ncbi:MAG: hypothetical protein ACN4GZ_01425 [Acidimicrobiales bacterium]
MASADWGMPRVADVGDAAASTGGSPPPVVTVERVELDAAPIVVVGESLADMPSLPARVVKVEASMVDGASEVGTASVAGAVGDVVLVVPAAAPVVGNVVRAVLTGFGFLVAGLEVTVAAGRVVVVARVALVVSRPGRFWGVVVVARFLVVAVD